MKKPNIAFIGGGNMATSLIGGLIGNGFDAAQIRVSDPLEENRQQFVQQHIATFDNNQLAVADASVVILAVKPQIMQLVATDIAPALGHQPLVISIAAGIPVNALQGWLGSNMPIIRCMPNTPALLKMGATGLFASEQVNKQQRDLGETILKAVGIVEWVADEALIDAVTAISGSGPAYYFLVMELMEKIGVELGLDQQASRKLTQQTALGAAQMAISSDVDIVELRRRVTSPAGTTERTINSFIEQGIEDVFRNALQACMDRAGEMAREFTHKEQE